MDRNATDRDLAVIAWQIGRPPRGVIGIAATCPYGYPQVTVNTLVLGRGDDFELFPNLFWLTCPFLVSEVGRLEAAGGVGAAERNIATDPHLAAAYARAHRAYAEERRRSTSDHDRALLREMCAEHAVDTGVGGLRNPRRVKCLHAQLAHFLARGRNPVGRWVAAQLSAPACPPEDVRCARATEG